jgi:cell division protein FtsW
MGGSSLLFTCFSIGIILSVARNVEQAEGVSLALATQQTEEKPSANNKESNEDE